MQDPDMLLFEKLEFPKSRKVSKREIIYLENFCTHGSLHEVVVNLGREQIIRDHIRALVQGKWLPDTIINGFLEYTVAQLRGLGLNVHVISSYIAHYFSTDKIPKKIGNPFQFERCGIPIYDDYNKHWSALIIVKENKKILYGNPLMSLTGLTSGFFQRIKNWLRHAHAEFYGTSELANWTFQEVRIPQQKNLQDCGVFTILYIISALMEIPSRSLFSQKDIPCYRHIFALNLINIGKKQQQLHYSSKHPSLLSAILFVLSGQEILTGTQIKDKIVSQKLFTYKKEVRLHNSVRLTLLRMEKEELVYKSYKKNKRVKYYSLQKLNFELNNSLDEKKNLASCKYPVPKNAKSWSAPQQILSVLHRYGPLETKQLEKLLIRDKYCTEIKPKLFRVSLFRLKETKLDCADGVLSLRENVLPKNWISATAANLGVHIRGKNTIVPLAAHHYYFDYSPESGIAVARTFTMKNTHFVLHCFAKNINQYDESNFAAMRLDLPSGKKITLDCTPTTHLSDILQARDVGPVVSVCKPLADFSGGEINGVDLFVVAVRDIQHGEEFTCCWNAGFNTQKLRWDFDYPEDWFEAEQYRIIDRHRIVERKKRVRESEENSKKVCLDLTLDD